MPRVITNHNTYYYIILLSVVSIGLYFVYQQVSADFSFWVDEAQMGRYLSREGQFDKAIDKFASSRPLAYLFINKIIATYHNTEFAFRATSLIPFIISIIIVYFLSSLIFKSKWTILFIMSLFSLNPYMISLSNEFKHYTLEIFTHLTVIILFFYYYNNIENKYLFITLMLTIILSLFLSGPNISFLLPGLFISILYKQHTDKINTFFTISLLTAAISLIVLYLEYHFIWSTSSDRFIKIWRDDYSAFHTDGNYFIWIFNKIISIIIYFYNYPSNVFSNNRIGYLFLPIFFIGVIYIFYKRNYNAFFIFILPLLFSIFFNYLSMWPLGTDRTNMFMIPYLIFIIGYGLSSFKLDIVQKTIIYIFTLFLLLPPSLHYYTERHSKYQTPNEDIKSALTYLIELDKTDKKYTLIMNYSASIAYEYYMSFNKKFSQYNSNFTDKFNTKILNRRNDKYIDKTLHELSTRNENLVFLLYHYGAVENLDKHLNHYFDYNEINYPRAKIIRVIDKKALPSIIINEKYIKKDPINQEPITINIHKDGVYKIEASVKAKDGNSNSLFISIDRKTYTWHLPKNKQWKLVKTPFILKLKKGSHIINIKQRETGTEFRSIKVINAN